MKIAAAYIRVSTEEQTELSPDSQVKLIREYAKKNDYIVPDEYIFHDDGISGRTTAKRPGFNRMIGTAKLKPRPFDAILLWKFSRFARNREDSIVYKSMLRKLGIEVVSISENVGDDKMSVLIEAMIEAMDEYYSINLAEEVKRGMLEKISRGKIVNAPPIGYTLKDGEYVPDENAPLVQRIFNMFIEGQGYKTIAVKLNDEGYRTVKGNTFENRNIEYIIRNPVYAGKLRWTPGGKGSQSHYHSDSEVMIVDGTHEPIIEPEIWEQAQQAVKEHKRRYTPFSRENPVKHDYMLRGLVRCSACGATLVSSLNGLQCHNYSKGRCTQSHYISHTKINESVLEGLKQALNNTEINIEYRTVKNITANDNTEHLLKREYEKLDRIKEAYTAGIDTLEEYKENKMKINEQIKKLQSRIPKQERKPSFKGTYSSLCKTIEEFLETAKDPEVSPSMLNGMLKTFVSKIVFSRAENKVVIFYYV
ncbi:MAG: recombinase family protein [Ruminococcus sp.]|nr:recombinase family protein [Ruminococcus sp.]